MAQYSNTKRVFTRIFNLRAMADVDRLKQYTTYLGKLFKTYFVLQPKSTKEDSFETVRTSLNLTDHDLEKKQRSLFWLSMLMLLVTCLFLSYAVYQFLYGSLYGAFPSCTLAGVAAALAFRYHFWHFQIKERKLGCTLAQWRKRNMKDEAK